MVGFSLFISDCHAGIKFRIVHFSAGFRTCYRNRGTKRQPIPKNDLAIKHIDCSGSRNSKAGENRLGLFLDFWLDSCGNIRTFDSHMLALPFLHMLYHIVCRTAIQTWRNRKQAALRKSLFSECALREIHLRSFEIALKDSNPLALMTSYNQLNGVYTGCSRDLVIDILRCEWGYKDLVMTDRGTKYDPAAALHTQVDMTMPGCDAVLAGLTDGSIPQPHCICERATQKEQESRLNQKPPVEPCFCTKRCPHTLYSGEAFKTLLLHHNFCRVLAVVSAFRRCYRSAP